MASGAHPVATPVRLDFRSVEQVVVHAEDENRFVMAAREAASACHQTERFGQWKEEFDRFLAAIYDWCRLHAGLVSRAYLAVSDEGLLVFLVTREEQYRFQDDDLVTDLDLALADHFPNCPATVLQVPRMPSESLASFFTPDSAMAIYGH